MSKILDPCCGSRMMWFDKQDNRAVFGDIRAENHTLCDGRSLSIEPDMHVDFRSMQFDSGSFKLVVFDPPHLVNLGQTSWMAKKYGVLSKDWREDLRKGFSECFRVLEPNGVLVFKWNETQIKVSEILKLTTEKPVFGHISGKRANTHWFVFLKDEKCTKKP
jgi:hypothetical protein